jgi:geranylgeranyl pyrophosphate synthase
VRLQSLRRSGRYPSVAAAVREAIGDIPGCPPLVDELERVLARPRWSLAPSGRMVWPRYVLATCEALGGDCSRAVWPAAAVEVTVAAIDVADDLIDGDLADLPAIMRARLTNAATALAFVGQLCMARAMACVPAENAGLIARLIATCAYGSAAGQDLDLLLETRPSPSTEEALEATRRKSGSLGAMACAVGAATATTDGHTLDLVQRFGNYLGTSAQLLNDMDGVGLGSEKSDLRQRKKTLPVTYLLAEAPRRTGAAALPTIVDAWYGQQQLLGATPERERELQVVLHDTGAVHFTWVIADAHYREAEHALQALSLYTGRPQVLELRHLLSSTKARRAR